MAITKVGSLNSVGAPVLRREVLGNSITTVVNDSLKSASGFAVLGTTGALVLGHILNHKDKDGVGLLTTGVAGAEVGSYANTYLTASNNQTVGFVAADVDVSKDSLYTSSLNAAVGTTANSNLSHFNFDLSTASTLLENSVVATTAQYHSWGIDRNNSAQVIVQILESQVFGV